MRGERTVHGLVELPKLVLIYDRDSELGLPVVPKSATSSYFPFASKYPTTGMAGLGWGWLFGEGSVSQAAGPYLDLILHPLSMSVDIDYPPTSSERYVKGLWSERPPQYTFQSSLLLADSLCCAGGGFQLEALTSDPAKPCRA